MWKKCKGFTLIELLVVITIIALLVAILLPSLARVQALAKRMACGTNLTAIGKAIATYATDQQGSWPMIPNMGVLTLNGAAGTGPIDAGNYTTNQGARFGGSDIIWNLGDPAVQASAPGAGTVTLASGWQHLNMIENLNLLMPSGYLQYKVFICPASGNSEAARIPGSATPLTGNQALSYGFYDISGACHNDYAYQVGYTFSLIRGQAATYACSTDMSREPDAGLVIMADAPPSTCASEADLCGITATTFNANAPSSAWNQGNHKRDGVNTLANYTVSWSNGKTGVGWNNNEIYVSDINGVSTPVANVLYTSIGQTGTAAGSGCGSKFIPNCLDDSLLIPGKLGF
jgi:prepilin-type N-terminal cleavage/methylation domain-containing protein